MHLSPSLVFAQIKTRSVFTQVALTLQECSADQDRYSASTHADIPALLQVQVLRSKLRRTEAQLQDVAKEAAPSPDSKKEAEELQRLRAQLEESLRNEERLRRQLEEVCPGSGAAPGPWACCSIPTRVLS